MPARVYHRVVLDEEYVVLHVALKSEEEARLTLDVELVGGSDCSLPCIRIGI